MRFFIAVGITLLFFQCHSNSDYTSENQAINTTEDSIPAKKKVELPPCVVVDTFIEPDPVLAKKYANYTFQPKPVQPVTKRMQKLADLLLVDAFKKENMRQMPIYGDSLMDVNFDGYADLVMQSYGMAGTGEKNHHYIRLYNPNTQNFVNDTLFLVNPTYNAEEGFVTENYLPHGGGWGAKYRWDGFRLDTIEVYEDYHQDYEDSYFWHCQITDRLTGKTTIYRNCDDRKIPEHYLEFKEFSHSSFDRLMKE